MDQSADYDLERAASCSEPVQSVVGTAGWSIPRAVSGHFAAEGSALARYAQRFHGVEINSTFYRSHRASTYARWRVSVPASFRFALKVPKAISHEKRLAGTETELAAFLDETLELGATRGPLLLQLPPSFAFDPGLVDAFLALMRKSFSGDFVVEPRHPSWFTTPAEQLLTDHAVARVAADPSPVGVGFAPGGFPDLVYLRLHGSPKTYFSPYDDTQLDELARALQASQAKRWVIFDNTASGAAAANALALMARLAPTF